MGRGQGIPTVRHPALDVLGLALHHGNVVGAALVRAVLAGIAGRRTAGDGGGGRRCVWRRAGL
ncbi:hypothetical protein ACH41E_25150 [Streptomyces sp. NPDC020412]|uniref:hypothetical protein n=1 Tax=Streptomyces sp. NPDC020412 TaxID=3365073 RepID=UPI0037BC69DE